MRGEFIGVWSETWREIWTPLMDQEGVPEDIYCEIYRELSEAFKEKPRPEVLADVIDDPLQSKDALQAISVHMFAGERALVVFFEKMHAALDDLVGDGLSNAYFNLLSVFVDKFSLRYDLRRPCALCPTLPGMFSSLVRDLRTATAQDPHLNSLMKDFENSLRDLREDSSDGRIKTCIQKQVNLLEAIGRNCPGVTETDLGGICKQVATWPHQAMKDALKNLYRFASDYPGIRHAGTPSNALRVIEMRDMVSICILLAGFTPYLSDQLNGEYLYRGR